MSAAATVSSVWLTATPSSLRRGRLASCRRTASAFCTDRLDSIIDSNRSTHTGHLMVPWKKFRAISEPVGSACCPMGGSRRSMGEPRFGSIRRKAATEECCGAPTSNIVSGGGRQFGRLAKKRSLSRGKTRRPARKCGDFGRCPSTALPPIRQSWSATVPARPTYTLTGSEFCTGKEVPSSKCGRCAIFPSKRGSRPPSSRRCGGESCSKRRSSPSRRWP